MSAKNIRQHFNRRNEKKKKLKRLLHASHCVAAPGTECSTETSLQGTDATADATRYLLSF